MSNDSDIAAVIERVRAEEAEPYVFLGDQFKSLVPTKDLRALIAHIDAQSARIAELERKIEGYQKECHAVEQALGKALRYPWFKDDLESFPDATEADGVCVGEHVPGTIAEEAAARIAALEGALAKCITAKDMLELQIARANARALLTTEKTNAD